MPQRPGTTLTNLARARLIAVGNVLLVVCVGALFFSQPEANGAVLAWFTGLDAAATALYFLPFARAKVTQDFAQWVRQLNGIAPEAAQQTTDAETRHAISPYVVINFAAIGYLVHFTGGPVGSPYSTFAFTMFVLGGLLMHSPPEVSLLHELEQLKERAWSHFIRSFFARYRFLLLLSALFYGALALLHWWAVTRVQIGEAPMWSHLVVLFVNLFISTVVTFVTLSLRD